MARDVLAAHADAGVSACLKHFPGHGSASADSHLELPDVTDVWQRDVELEAFRQLVSDDVFVMTAHLRHSGLDAEFPASLSRKVTTDLLRGELGFGGKVVTDSLDMAGARQGGSLARTLQLAADSGADYLLHGCNSRLGETAADVIAAACTAEAK